MGTKGRRRAAFGALLVGAAGFAGALALDAHRSPRVDVRTPARATRTSRVEPRVSPRALSPHAVAAIAEHGRAFRPRDVPGRFVLAHVAQGFAVRVDDRGLAVDALRSDASLALSHATLRGAPERASVRIDEGACASDGARLADGRCARRLEIERSVGLVEWWESRADGLEQGFVVAQRPDRADGPLEVRIGLEGAHVVVDGSRDARLVTDAGRALAYRGLRAFDAEGVELIASLHAAPGGSGLVITVEDAHAHYPVFVDPILSATPSWTVDSGQSLSNFSYSVDGAGDVNGDGFDDVVVGARWYDAGEFNEGAAFVYLGSSTGLGDTAAWFAEANQSSSSFGRSVAGVGDVNADGYDDVLVGARDYDVNVSDEGAAFLFLGGPSGPSATPDWTYGSGQASGGFGISVSGAGDVDADGFDDVVIGASTYDDPESNEGAVFVFLGGAMGLSTSPSLVVGSDLVNAYLGSSVSGAGDVDGDGFDDIVAGAWAAETPGESNEGFAYVFLGGVSGPSAPAATVLQENQAEANFGWSVHGAGDVNGDGFDDVIVGALGWDDGQTNEGRVFVYHGSASGLSPIHAAAPQSDLAGAFFGWTVASAGDVDRDGFADVLVGAPFAANGQANEGRAYLYRGSATGLRDTYEWVAESDQANAYFGYSVASAGDVNGDAYGDVVVGSLEHSGAVATEGRAFVYLATPDDAGIDAGVDAGMDAGFDAGFDAGVDAAFDAGFDAGMDAGFDAGFDAGVDAGFDAGVDAGFDAGVDAGFDAGVDAGFDAGSDAGSDASVDAGTDTGTEADADVDAAIGDGGAGFDAGYVGPVPTVYCDCRVAGASGAGGRPSAAMTGIVLFGLSLRWRTRRRRPSAPHHASAGPGDD